MGLTRTLSIALAIAVAWPAVRAAAEEVAAFSVKDAVAGIVEQCDFDDAALERICAVDKASAVPEAFGEIVSRQVEQRIGAREQVRLEAARRIEAKRVAQEAARTAACTRLRIKPGSARLGMTPKQVRECGWGDPERINRTVSTSGTSEQWVYDGDQYLYFRNGRLTTIQQSQ